MKFPFLKYYFIGGWVTALGLSLILYLINLSIGNHAPPKEPLALLTSPLSTSPVYLYKPGNAKSSGSHAIRLRLQDYPRINFDNEGHLLSATDYKTVVAEIKSGDTVSLLVLKEELAKFGNPETPLSISEQFAVPPYVEFYSLKFRNREYVSGTAKTSTEQSKNLAIAFAIFGSIFIFFGLRYMIIKR